jgi:hypothetical protein
MGMIAILVSCRWTLEGVCSAQLTLGAAAVLNGRGEKSCTECEYKVARVRTGVAALPGLAGQPRAAIDQSADSGLLWTVRANRLRGLKPS